jgi:putative colanic acid biosynthesis acetyltransferase WcaF
MTVGIPADSSQPESVTVGAHPSSHDELLRLLRRFGAQVGRHVHIHPTARIFIPWDLSIGDWSSVGFDALLYNLGPLKIGQRVTISQRAHLCGGTHDHRDPTMPLIKSPITIEDDAWVCADAFLGPGVNIGEGAVVAARAVVVKDVVSSSVVGGNPARLLRDSRFRDSD